MILNTHIVQDIEDNSPSIDSNDNGDTDTPVQKETILEIQTKTADKTEEYMVLARKYRPMDFDSLIGQDALVRTLSNALKVGRVAQAFMHYRCTWCRQNNNRSYYCESLKLR